MFKGNILEKIAEKFNLVFNFFVKKNSPTTKNNSEVNNSSVGNIQQAQHISNDMRSFTGSESYISDIELRILKELYLSFRETKKYPHLPLGEVHEKLNISDGDYIGTVNNSEFIKIDGNDYVIKESGIRFMDSFVRNNKPEIDIISLSHSGGHRGQELTGLRLINNGSGVAVGIDCYLCADGLNSIKFARIERLASNEELRSSLGFLYSDTPFFGKPLENLRIILKYKNNNGFKFTSGRYLSQTKMATGDYKINNALSGDYFES